MALSYNEYIGDGSQTLYTTPPYLDPSHIQVAVGGTAIASSGYTLSGTSLTFNTAPVNGAAILINRKTSQNQRLTNYEDASLLTADVMDADATQLFYMTQEALDWSEGALTKDDNLNYSAGQKRIVDVADPVNPQDVATRSFVANQIAAGTGAVTVDSIAPTSAKKGDLWIDTADNVMYVYTGSEWVNGGVQETERHDFLGSDAYLESADQSYFAGTLHDGSVSSIFQLYLNGVLLKPTTTALDFTTGDYNVLNAAVLSIKPAPSASDEITVVKSASISAAILEELTSLKESAVLVTTVGHGGRSIKETITATDGQTVLNLTNSYVQDINNVSVYVNGVRQSAYVESTTTSITLTNPLTVGDEVVVIINEYSVNQGGHINPKPNLLINGDFDIWQRGTSFTTLGASNYTADRWIGYDATGFNTTVSQGSPEDVNGLRTTPLKFERHTLSSAGGITQRIENGDAVYNKTVTMSFWAKVDSGVSSLSPNLIFRDSSGNTLNPDEAYDSPSLAVTTSWQFFTHTMAINESFTEAQREGMMAQVYIKDLLDVATYSIAQVKLEEGTNFTGWPHVDPTTELAKCQRYFATSYAQGESVGQAATSNAPYRQMATKTAAGGGAITFNVQFPVTMRETSPTIQVYSTFNGVAGQFYNETTGDNKSISYGTKTDKGFYFGNASAQQITDGNYYSYHYTANAEL